MGCASSAMDTMNRLTGKEEAPMDTEEQAGGGLDPAVEGGMAGMTTTTSSLYGTVMATSIVAKSLAQKREDIINSFNTTMYSFHDSGASVTENGSCPRPAFALRNDEMLGVWGGESGGPPPSKSPVSSHKSSAASFPSMTLLEPERMVAEQTDDEEQPHDLGDDGDEEQQQTRIAANLDEKSSLTEMDKEAEGGDADGKGETTADAMAESGNTTVVDAAGAQDPKAIGDGGAGGSNNKPDVVATIDDQQISLETKMQQEKGGSDGEKGGDNKDGEGKSSTEATATPATTAAVSADASTTPSAVVTTATPSIAESTSTDAGEKGGGGDNASMVAAAN